MNYEKLTLEKCNVIKTIMMLSVILCHSLAVFSRNGWGGTVPTNPSAILGIISDWMGTYHVYTFTFISGYIFYFLKYERHKYQDYKHAVIERAKRLLIPYGFSAVVWVIPFYVVLFKPSVKTVAINYVLGAGPAQLWFLLMILLCFSIFLMLADIMKKASIIQGVCISLLIYGIGVIGGALLPNIFQIWTACRFFTFFYLGFAMRQGNLQGLYIVPWFVWPMLNIAFFLVDYNYFATNSGSVLSYCR